MAYTKTTWVTGDVITADKLNNLEAGVEALDAVEVVNIDTVNVTVDNSTGVPSATGTVNGSVLTLEFVNLKGEQGEKGEPGQATIIDTVDVQLTEDDQVEGTAAEGSIEDTTLKLYFTNLKGADGEDGTKIDRVAVALTTDESEEASAAVSLDEEEGENVLNFTFTNLKGEKGDDGEDGTKINSVLVNLDGLSSATPTGDATLENGVLTLNFYGLKGADGTTVSAEGGAVIENVMVTITEDAAIEGSAGSAQMDGTTLQITLTNIKGADGENGKDGEDGTKIDRVAVALATNDSEEASATVSLDEEEGENVLNFTFTNLKGEKGDDGEDGTKIDRVTVTIADDELVEGATGAATLSEVEGENVLALTLTNIKGEDGADGADGTKIDKVEIVLLEDDQVEGSAGSATLAEVENEMVLTLTFTNLKGEKGDAGTVVSGEGGTVITGVTVNLTEDAGVQGTTASGEISENVLVLTFTNLKGEKGDDGEDGTKIDRVAVALATEEGGEASATVSLDEEEGENVLNFTFTNLKGADGENGADGTTIDRVTVAITDDEMVEGAAGAAALSEVEDETVLALTFTNIKGADGADGTKIDKVDVVLLEDDQVETSTGSATLVEVEGEMVLTLTFTNLKGEKGDAGTSGSGDGGTVIEDVAITITEDAGVEGSAGSAQMDGTTLRITLTNIKGADGEKGEDGEDGTTIDRVTVTINDDELTEGAAGTATLSEVEGENVLAFTLTNIKGEKGDAGDTPTFTVGNVTTGDAGSTAQVTLGGTAPAYELNFTIPKGDTGDNGAAPNISVGNVTTGEAGTNAAVTIDGTAPDYTLDFTIPKGADGATPTLAVGNVTTGDAGTNAQVSVGGTAPDYTLDFTIPKGADGATPTLAVGNVTTGEAGSNAQVSIGGTAPDYTLDFTIPQGQAGAAGADAPTITSFVLYRDGNGNITSGLITFSDTNTVEVSVTTQDA